MRIAILSEKDIDDIIELYNTDFADGWNKDMLSSSFNNGRFCCFGAYDGQRLIGVITLTIGLDDADIEGVVTKSDYRRKGVAGELLKKALEHIESLGIKKVILEVRASNVPAINLYYGQRFYKISVRKKYYANGEDALILIKEI